ncbi:placenta-specific gene 8 protein-like [Branchiostoma floridae x Branchiostoma japonicum]
MASVHPAADPTQEQKGPMAMAGQYPPVAGPAFPAMPMQPQVIPQQPGGYVATMGPQKREWSSGLGACCDNPNSCLLSFFCAQCYTCHLLPRMDENCWVGWMGWPWPPLGYGIFGMRVKMREQHNIHGDLCTDACTSIWCPWCALAQMSREMDYVSEQPAMVRQ